MRSAYLDTELMLVIKSDELNAQLRGIMSEYEKSAVTALPDHRNMTANMSPGTASPITRKVDSYTRSTGGLTSRYGLGWQYSSSSSLYGYADGVSTAISRRWPP